MTILIETSCISGHIGYFGGYDIFYVGENAKFAFLMMIRLWLLTTKVLDVWFFNEQLVELLLAFWW